MEDYKCWKLPIGTLEFIPSTHEYLFEGQLLPSITQILGTRFGNKYNGVSKEVLERAAQKGTAVHESIQNFEEQDIETDLVELRNYKFLKKHYKWKVRRCEVPVVLFKNDKAIAAGMLDLDVIIDDLFGILDVKRTAVFDKDYVALQTNLYRISYRQTYGEEAAFVGGLHLREEKRKFYKLPIDENMAWALIDEYLSKQ